MADSVFTAEISGRRGWRG